jgi:hypothetical protein
MSPVNQMRVLWFLSVAVCVSAGCKKPDAKAEAKPEAALDAKPGDVATDQPARAPIAITGIPECDRFIGLGVALIDCEPERRATMLPMFQQMVENARTALADGDPETREAFRSLCEQNVKNVLEPGQGSCALVIPERDYTAELQLEGERRVGVATLEHCTAYVDAIDKLLRCDRLSADARAQMKAQKTELLDALSQHKDTPEAERIGFDGLCWDTLEALRTSLPAIGCTL